MKLQTDDKRIIRLTEKEAVLSLFNPPDYELTIDRVDYRLDYFKGGYMGKPFICRYKLQKEVGDLMRVCLKNRIYKVIEANLPSSGLGNGELKLTIKGIYPLGPIYGSTSKFDITLWNGGVEYHFLNCLLVGAGHSDKNTSKLDFIYDYWTKNFTA